jgi:hypothetical protein
MAAQVNSNQNYTFQLEQREHFVFFQVNQCKIAIFNKDSHFQNFRFRAPDCNVIILGSIEVEDAIEIEAVNTVVMGKLQSNQGDLTLKGHKRFVTLGGGTLLDIKGNAVLDTKRYAILGDLITTEQDSDEAEPRVISQCGEIRRVFHDAIAQASPQNLCLGLREMVQTILSRENSSAQRPDTAERKE